MFSSKSIRIIFIAIVFMMLLVPGVSAHRVYLQEQIKDVQIKTWFGGGDPMVDAEISIYAVKNGQEELYIEDRTDSEGLYHFTPKLGVSEYRVVVSESGHKNEKTFNLAAGSLASQEEAELPLYANIISGLGYIVGLAGFAMYFSSRKANN
jgi:nickel transport protein